MKPGVAFFIGIGGAGMSSLARVLNKSGWSVYGYDRTNTRLTKALESEGINIVFDDSIEAIPQIVLKQSKADLLLVTTPAISPTHPQLSYLVGLGYKCIKRAQLLSDITEGKPTLAIAGTHGKTSTTAILAHILNNTSEGCNAFIGGICVANNSNIYWSELAKWTVIEADEFDRSFHSLHPSHAVITSIDPDHLDIYKTEDKFVEAFQKFASQVQGKVIIQKDIDFSFDEVERYGIVESEIEREELPHYASEIEADSLGMTCRFSLGKGDMIIERIKLPLLGLHNLENALAAAVLAYIAGARKDVIKSSIESFPGIYRRFQIHVNTKSRVYIDDYAHHPTELKKTIEAVRTHFPGRHLTVIFQPHLYSRTQYQLEGFCTELAKTDRLILLPIYGAREKQITGFNAQSIFEKISHPHAETSTINSIFGKLKTYPVDVLLTVGAGDIDILVPALQKWASIDDKNENESKDSHST